MCESVVNECVMNVVKSIEGKVVVSMFGLWLSCVHRLLSETIPLNNLRMSTMHVNSIRVLKQKWFSISFVQYIVMICKLPWSPVGRAFLKRGGLHPSIFSFGMRVTMVC